MKAKSSFLVTTMLIAASSFISGCDEQPSESGPQALPPSTALTRDPYENQDDYMKQQQGFRGPCGQKWDKLEYDFNAWISGKGTKEQYLWSKQDYDRCCIQNYKYNGGGSGGPQ